MRLEGLRERTSARSDGKELSGFQTDGFLPKNRDFCGWHVLQRIHTPRHDYWRTTPLGSHDGRRPRLSILLGDTIYD